MAGQVPTNVHSPPRLSPLSAAQRICFARQTVKTCAYVEVVRVESSNWFSPTQCSQSDFQTVRVMVFSGRVSRAQAPDRADTHKKKKGLPLQTARSQPRWLRLCRKWRDTRTEGKRRIKGKDAVKREEHANAGPNKKKKEHRFP
ncbi:hypothetical protein BDY21DRAFT_158930 [Lineolata rhizophorae]|uniref:Uncharacterized protein n=1 Tax=Lineolata rhizophorae TaxID=578093 RepID=A0A6A6NLA9_9PEZI|nr:hypothetical protein BDY21DRAFT_158930 [Lineolata rhizophorae]